MFCAQLVCAFDVDGDGPVRFGLPVPQGVLERGLRLRGDRGARMQWSPLFGSPPASGDRLWIEVAVIGQHGRARLELGGDGPSDPARGSVVQVFDEAVDRQGEEVLSHSRRVWRWADGSEDRRERRILAEADEEREAGEAITTESDGLAARRARVRIQASFWRDAGVLPPADGSGRFLRDELLGALPYLRRAPGARGKGDFVRGEDGATVTNGEFDTALAFARLAMCTGRSDLLEQARACAWHLCDVDLDRRSGLPFRHGGDHRSAGPETGHVWVHGALLVASLYADRDLLAEVLSIATSLAQRARATEHREGIADRLRDEAWPLCELEASLRFVDSEPIRDAADHLAAVIEARFDPVLGCFRYGEGETRAGKVYRDRLWLSAGILIPALRAHAARVGGPSTTADATEAAMLPLLLSGREGVAIQVWRVGKDSFDPTQVTGVAEPVLLLDGLSVAARRRVLSRSNVRAAWKDVLDPRHDDLVTRFTMLARCSWVMR